MTRQRALRTLPMSETDLQNTILDMAARFGWRAMHIYDSRRSVGAGYPDLTLLHKATGVLLLAELKKADGRVSVEQQGWIDDFAKGGLIVHVWRPAHLRSGQIEAALRNPVAA